MDDGLIVHSKHAELVQSSLKKLQQLEEINVC